MVACRKAVGAGKLPLIDCSCIVAEAFSEFTSFISSTSPYVFTLERCADL